MPLELEQVHLLAIGAHPDDVEFALGGTLARHVRMGYRVGVVDLTRGELGSKGNPALRAQEAAAAARVYGASFRLCLDLGDNRVVDDPDVARRLAALIRSCRPSLVFAHDGDDRHPDHRGAFALVRRAVFLAALRSLDLGAPHHVVDRLCYFPLNETVRPHFVVDVTDEWPQKEAAMRAFQSQFVDPTLEIDHRFFGVDDYLEMARVRARLYGQFIGVRYGEGFLCQDAVPVSDLIHTFVPGSKGGNG